MSEPFWIKLNNRCGVKDTFIDEPVCEYYETAVHVRRVSPTHDAAYEKLPDMLAKLRDEFITNYSPTHDFNLIIELKDINALCEASLSASKDGFNAGADAMRTLMQAEIDKLNKRIVEVNGFLYDANAEMDKLVEALESISVYGNDIDTVEAVLVGHRAWKEKNI